MTIDSHKPLHQSAFMNAMRRLQPFWRVAAFVVLIGWITAFGICSAHCALGQIRHAGEADSEALPPCHGGPMQGNPDSNSGKATSFCITIKSLHSPVADLALHPPQTVALFQPVFAALNAVEVDFIHSAQLLRQCGAPDWVFTPEVSLGPAFRSHAPPLL